MIENVVREREIERGGQGVRKLAKKRHGIRPLLAALHAFMDYVSLYACGNCLRSYSET